MSGSALRKEGTMSQRQKAAKKERHRHGHAFGPNNDQRKAHGHAAKEGRRARRRLDNMIILDEIQFMEDEGGE